MTRRIAVTATALVLIVFVLVGVWLWINNQQEPREGGIVEDQKIENIHLTIGTFSKALGNTPYHIAKYFRYFENDPRFKDVKITHKEFNDRSSIGLAFDKGDLQILFSAEIPVILSYAQGNQIQIAEISAIAAQEIVVPVESPIFRVSQLRGENLAVLAATSSHYCLLKVLRENDLTVDDLDIDYMSPGEARVRFEDGKLPAWAVWAPWVEEQEVSGVGRPIADSKANISSVMTLSNNFVVEHPELAQATVELIRKAKKWVQENPNEAQEIAALELEEELAVVKQAWPKFNWNARLSEADLPDFRDKAQFLSETGQTRRDIQVAVEELVSKNFGE